MKTGAIICEYNPLHNGHAYHIAQTRKAGVTHLTALLSDDFVQRGDVALLNKFDRAELALQAGADLVLELPVPYSCASAEFYAGGAVSVLQRLHVMDVLSFGSSADLNALQALAELSLEITNHNQETIQEKMHSGCSYPRAVWEIVAERSSPALSALLRDPNNLLAVEYLKAMRRQKADFQAFAVRRDTVMHDSAETNQEFASASYLREAFANQGAYQAFVPFYTMDMLSIRWNEGRTASFSRLEKLILYRMRTMSEAELLTLPDMTPALARRFLKAGNQNHLTDFLNVVKSKCFTMARIRRILMYALTGVRKEDLHMEIPYVRVLGFNQRGREVLRLMKAKSEILSGTSLMKLQKSGPEAARFAELEIRTANVYGLSMENPTSAEQEFRKKITMEE